MSSDKDSLVFGPGRPLLSAAALLASALCGAAAALLAQQVGSHLSRPTQDSATPTAAFEHTRAAAVLGELTPAEVSAVARFFITATGAAARRGLVANTSQPWIAGPSGVELFAPPKSDVLAYLDDGGAQPPRHARVTAVLPSEGATAEYRVGPLMPGGVVAPSATVEEVARVAPLSKRPTEPGADAALAAPLLDATLRAIGSEILHGAMGPIFPALAPAGGFDREARGEAISMMVNDALSPTGERYDIYRFQWLPPRRVSSLESFWLHPLPLRIRVNATAADAAVWHALSVSLCGRLFASAAELRAARESGAMPLCRVRNETGNLPWEVPRREDAPSGRRRVEAKRGVRWGGWRFTVSPQRPSSGPALLDVSFGGERVLYELSLQDAMAAYSGDDEAFFYSDAAWSLSMLSASLEPGVDCPSGATYFEAATWYQLQETGSAVADATRAVPFYPTCVFEWQEDHTIWRHMENAEPPRVRGLGRRTLVVRSIATVANYDYITDVKFREDGEIEASVRFAGYIEARHYTEAGGDGAAHESLYSSLLRPGLAGPVHCHIAAFKADFDIGGVRANTLRVTSVGASDAPPSPREPFPRPRHTYKVLSHRDVEAEGIGASTFVADPRRPGAWTIVDRAAASPAGSPRGYAVTLGSFATTQVLPDDHPFVRAMPFSKYHLAVTAHHDHERRLTSPYVQYDGEEASGAQDLDRFLSDGESLLDADLVAWIAVGREHVVRQEDLPLVSNFGVAFSLQPWNFLPWNAAASGLPPSLSEAGAGD